MEPLSNYAVGRLRRDFRGGASAVGGMFTAVHRDLDEAVFSPLRQSAYTGGVDWLHRFNRNAWTFTGYLGGSWVNGSTSSMLLTQSLSSRYYQRPDQDYVVLDSTRTSLAGMNGSIGISETAGNWTFGARGSFISPGYEGNDAGFQTDADRVRFGADGGRRWLAPGETFRELRASASASQAINFGGTSVSPSLGANLSGTLTSLWSFNLNLGWGFQSFDDKATRGGPLLERPAGWHLGGGFRSDGRKSLSFGANGFYTGHVEGTRGGGAGLDVVYRQQGSVDFSAAIAYRRPTTTSSTSPSGPTPPPPPPQRVAKIETEQVSPIVEILLPQGFVQAKFFVIGFHSGLKIHILTTRRRGFHLHRFQDRIAGDHARQQECQRVGK